MKLAYVGLMLLCTLAVSWATTGNSGRDSHSNQVTQQREPASSGRYSEPAPATTDHHAAILSRAEADSLSMRGDSLFTQSEIGDIKVGEFGGNDLIYVLIVVLLVVVILAVAR